MALAREARLSDIEEADEIRARIKGAFAPFYQTLLSIIQGTALAFLLTKVDVLIQQQRFHAPQIVVAVGIFLSIVALWNQYQMGVMIYYWTSTLSDAFIPFIFGIFEFAMIIGMQHSVQVVLLIFGLFFVVATFGFEYFYFQIRRSAPEDAFTHRLNSGFRALDAAFAVGSAIVFLGAAAVLARVDTFESQLSGACLIVALAILHLWRQAYEWGLLQRRLSLAK